MGWTHDYRDASLSRRTVAARITPQGVVAEQSGRIADPPLGIPHILRRRARWMSARLRHPRG